VCGFCIFLKIDKADLRQILFSGFRKNHLFIAACIERALHLAFNLTKLKLERQLGVWGQAPSGFCIFLKIDKADLRQILFSGFRKKHLFIAACIERALHLAFNPTKLKLERQAIFAIFQ